MMLWLLLLIAAHSTIVDEVEPDFLPLIEQLEKQNGIWGLNNHSVAKQFYQCFDTSSDEKDASAISFVADDNDRAYWVGVYLSEPAYLGHRKPRPLLALAIWANASERMASLEDTDAGDERSLNMIAAIQAKKLGLVSLAQTFKTRSEAANLKGAGGPATSRQDSDVYDSIQLPPATE